jgi:hypothetical protein
MTLPKSHDTSKNHHHLARPAPHPYLAVTRTGAIMTQHSQTEIELQAATYRRLQKHLMQDRTDVQNIDMMNLAGFCRNCLSRWYQEAAAERGIEIGKMEARELFYGMSMDDWKANNQTEATDAQKDAFKIAFEENVGKD